MFYCWLCSLCEFSHFFICDMSESLRLQSNAEFMYFPERHTELHTSQMNNCPHTSALPKLYEDTDSVFVRHLTQKIHFNSAWKHLECNCNKLQLKALEGLPTGKLCVTLPQECLNVVTKCLLVFYLSLVFFQRAHMKNTYSVNHINFPLTCYTLKQFPHILLSAGKVSFKAQMYPV